MAWSSKKQTNHQGKHLLKPKTLQIDDEPTPQSDESDATATPSGTTTPNAATTPSNDEQVSWVPAAGGSHVSTLGNHKINAKGIIIIVAVVIAILAAAYFGASYFFMSHFGFKTTINGVNCSFMTVEDVDQLMADTAAEYTLELIERGDESEIIDGADIGVSYDLDSNQVQALLDDQNPFLFFMRLFDSDSEDLSVEFLFDQELLDAHIATLDCVVDEDVTQPQNAYLEFDGSSYVVCEEVLGNVIDTEVLSTVIADTVKSGLDSVDLDEQNCYVAPEITSESAELQEQIELLNTYVPFALTYTFTDGSTEVLDGVTVFDWLTIADDSSYSVDEDAVRSWVSDFASRHTTVGSSRTFTSVDGNTYSVSGGTYGWSVDEDAEVEAIINMLETKESETRDPYWATTAEVANAADGEADWGSTYIELNLTSQHMYFVQDGEIAFEADVVTGLPDGDRDTPEGVYYILEKLLDKTLVGEADANGNPSYQIPVDYWMRITWTGIGFHDATWQSSFGGTRYLTNGSHGCINMSWSDAATLYDMVWVGLPVVCHF